MAIHFWSVSEASGHEKSLSTASETVGYAAGLMTWVLAASVFVAIKLSNNEMPPWTFCCVRAFLSALVLLPFVASHYHDIMGLVRTRGWEALFIGGIGLGLTQGTAFTALSHTTVVNFGIIFGTAPIITMALARIVLREPMNAWQIAGALTAFAGIIVVAVHGSLQQLLGLDFNSGDLITLAAACMFAIYTVMLKRAKFNLPRLPLLVVLLFGGAIAALPFFLIEYWLGYHTHLAMRGYLALAYVVVPGGALLYFLYNSSIDILGASRAGTLVYSQMIFTTILAWLILGEAIEWYHYLGACLIVVGIVLVTRFRPKPPAVPSASS